MSLKSLKLFFVGLFKRAVSSTPGRPSNHSKALSIFLSAKPASERFLCKDSLSNSTATISHGLLPAAYGGAASLLGYFFQKDLENESEEKISLSLFSILATVLLFIWITPIASTAGILSAVDFKAFLVLGVTCLVSLIMGRRKDKEVGACLSDAAIYSGVISLSFALSAIVLSLR